MTTFDIRHVRCAVCGSVHDFRVIARADSSGPPDLEFRAYKADREVLSSWVQECPDCGFAAKTLDLDTSVNKEWLKEEACQTCEGHDFRSPLARQFYHCYMAALHDGRLEDAANALMFSAWASDDENDLSAAKMCRMMAADLYPKVPEDEETEIRMVIRMDLLRRSGQFDTLLREYENYQFTDPFFRRICRFQKKRAAEHDDQKYTFNMILNNRIPAD